MRACGGPAARAAVKSSSAIRRTEFRNQRVLFQNGALSSCEIEMLDADLRGELGLGVIFLCSEIGIRKGAFPCRNVSGS